MQAKQQLQKTFTQVEEVELSTKFLSFSQVLKLSFKVFNRKFWLGFILPLILSLPIVLLFILLNLIFIAKLETGNLNLIIDGTLLVAIWLLSFASLLIYALQWSYLNSSFDETNFSKFLQAELQKTLSLLNFIIICVSFVLICWNFIIVTDLLNFGSVGPIIVMTIVPFIVFFVILLLFYTPAYILSYKTNLSTNLVQAVNDIKGIYTVNLFRVLKAIALIILISLITSFLGIRYLPDQLHQGLDTAVTLFVINFVSSLYFVSFNNAVSFSQNAGSQTVKPVKTWSNNLIVGFAYALIILWFMILALS